MTFEAVHRSAVPSSPTVALRPPQGWFSRNRAAIVRHAVINFFMLIIILPLVWVLLMSVKTLPDAMRGDFWPRQFDFTHYSYVFERIRTLPVNLFNSIYVTAFTVLLTTICAVLAGYALVHLRPRGAGLVVAALLASLYFPVRVVSLISIYETQHWLGLINNTAGLILPYVTLQLAISILIMRSMFQLVPHEMIEAAKIDGAGPLRFFVDTVIPLSLTNIAALFVILFIYGWNQYLWPILAANARSMTTIIIGMRQMIGNGDTQTEWHIVMATALLAILPPVAVVLLMQRWFVRGLVEAEK